MALEYPNNVVVVESAIAAERIEEVPMVKSVTKASEGSPIESKSVLETVSVETAWIRTSYDVSCFSNSCRAKIHLFF